MGVFDGVVLYDLGFRLLVGTGLGDVGDSSLVFYFSFGFTCDFLVDEPS